MTLRPRPHPTDVQAELTRVIQDLSLTIPPHLLPVLAERALACSHLDASQAVPVVLAEHIEEQLMTVTNRSHLQLGRLFSLMTTPPLSVAPTFSEQAPTVHGRHGPLPEATPDVRSLQVDPSSFALDAAPPVAPPLQDASALAASSPTSVAPSPVSAPASVSNPLDASLDLRELSAPSVRPAPKGGFLQAVRNRILGQSKDTPDVLPAVHVPEATTELPQSTSSRHSVGGQPKRTEWLTVNAEPELTPGNENGTAQLVQGPVHFATSPFAYAPPTVMSKTPTSMQGQVAPSEISALATRLARQLPQGSEVVAVRVAPSDTPELHHEHTIIAAREQGAEVVNEQASAPEEHVAANERTVAGPVVATDAQPNAEVALVPALQDTTVQPSTITSVIQPPQQEHALVVLSSSQLDGVAFGATPFVTPEQVQPVPEVHAAPLLSSPGATSRAHEPSEVAEVRTRRAQKDAATPSANHGVSPVTPVAFEVAPNNAPPQLVTAPAVSHPDQDAVQVQPLFVSSEVVAPSETSVVVRSTSEGVTFAPHAPLEAAPVQVTDTPHLPGSDVAPSPAFETPIFPTAAPVGSLLTAGSTDAGTTAPIDKHEQLRALYTTQAGTRPTLQAMTEAVQIFKALYDQLGDQVLAGHYSAETHREKDLLTDHLMALMESALMQPEDIQQWLLVQLDPFDRGMQNIIHDFKANA